MIDLYYVNEKFKYEASIRKIIAGDTISWWLKTWQGPARFTRDFVRATLEECYDQIEFDVEQRGIIYEQKDT